ncbi:hypothetical protein B8133_25720 [Salmonella enterica]|nr:hypothetical protein [Salmonella enterica]
MLVCEYIWMQMHNRLRASRKRITDDMTGNLITLAGIMTWNTAQLMGGKDYVEIFAPSYAAQKIGVKASAWSRNYKKHCLFMYDKCEELDSQALEKLMQKN